MCSIFKREIILGIKKIDYFRIYFRIPCLWVHGSVRSQYREESRQGAALQTPMCFFILASDANCCCSRYLSASQSTTPRVGRSCCSILPVGGRGHETRDSPRNSCSGKRKKRRWRKRRKKRKSDRELQLGLVTTTTSTARCRRRREEVPV